MSSLLDSNWLWWPAGIALWLTLGWGLFAWRETLGIEHKDKGGYITLSYFCWRVFQAWPPSIFLVGLFVGLFWGALAVHLLWHWCPAGALSVG